MNHAEKKTTTTKLHLSVVDQRCDDSVTYHVRRTSPGSSRFIIKTCALSAGMGSKRVLAKQSLQEEGEEQQHLPLKKRIKYGRGQDSAIVHCRQRYNENTDSNCSHNPSPGIPALKHQICNSSLASQQNKDMNMCPNRDSFFSENISSKEHNEGNAVRKGMTSIPAITKLVNAKDVYFYSDSKFSADSANSDDDPADSTSTITSEHREKSSLNLFSLPLKWFATGKRSSRKRAVYSIVDTHGNMEKFRHAHSTKCQQLDIMSIISPRMVVHRSVFDDEKLLKGASIDYPRPKEVLSRSYKFKCTTCSKSFSTHQALGGHRSSHSNKNKDCRKRSAKLNAIAKEKKETIRDPIASHGSPNTWNNDIRHHTGSSPANTLNNALSRHAGSSPRNTLDNAVSHHTGSSLTNTLDNALNHQTGCSPPNILPNALSRHQTVSRKVFDFDLNEPPPMDEDEDKEAHHHLASTSANTPQPLQASTFLYQWNGSIFQLY